MLTYYLLYSIRQTTEDSIIRHMLFACWITKTAKHTLRICSRLRLKCDGTRAETRFRLSAKRTSPFKSARGRQFSRLLAAEVCVSAVVMLDTPCSEVVWRVLATHSIHQIPPSLPLPCVTVCHHISTGLYLLLFHVNSGYANAPQCYVNTYIASLVVLPSCCYIQLLPSFCSSCK